jgi:hypothetical protein
VMLQSQQRHPWGHRKTRHRCESHRGHRFSLGSRPCPAAKHLGFHWLRTGLLWWCINMVLININMIYGIIFCNKPHNST